jgi:hypothetical protein
MTDYNITPPPVNLLHQWMDEASNKKKSVVHYVARKAAQWGADQELDAVIEWMKRMGYWGEDGMAIPALRAARRPKPPSLKEQALELAKPAGTDGAYVTFGPEELALIRRALEQLDD